MPRRPDRAVPHRGAPSGTLPIRERILQYRPADAPRNPDSCPTSTSIPPPPSRPSGFLGITREIWEQRRIGTLKRHYADDITVRSPASVVVGNAGVIPATMATLAEFPDRELLGEDVLHHGNRRDGFLSSHRLMCLATHTRPGLYGAPTNRALRYRILADCAVRDDRVYDEWLVRDQGAIVRQLGLDPKRWAADLIEREGGPAHCVRPLTPDTDIAPRYTGHGDDSPFGEHYAEFLRRLMDAEFGWIPETYDRACRLELPGGSSAHGWREADAFWMGLRAALPDATFTVHHAMGPRRAGRAAGGRPALDADRHALRLGHVRHPERCRGARARHLARRVRPLGPAPGVRAVRRDGDLEADPPPDRLSGDRASADGGHADRVAVLVDGLEPDVEPPEPLQVTEHGARVVAERAPAVAAVAKLERAAAVPIVADDLDVRQLPVAGVLIGEQSPHATVARLVVDAVDLEEGAALAIGDREQVETRGSASGTGTAR